MGEDEIKRFQVTIPRDLYLKLDRLASDAGLRKTDVMRELIEGWVADRTPNDRNLEFHVLVCRPEPTCVASFFHEADAKEFAERWRKKFEWQPITINRGDKVWHVYRPNGLEYDMPIFTIDEDIRALAKIEMGDDFSEERIDCFISAAANVTKIVYHALDRFENGMCLVKNAEDLPSPEAAAQITTELIKAGEDAVSHFLFNEDRTSEKSKRALEFIWKVEDAVKRDVRANFESAPEPAADRIKANVAAAKELGGEYPYKHVVWSKL